MLLEATAQPSAADEVFAESHTVAASCAVHAVQANNDCHAMHAAAAASCAVHAVQVLSLTVMQANVPPIQRAALDEQLTTFVNTVGACERIQKTPIPLPYTRSAIASRCQS